MLLNWYERSLTFERQASFLREAGLEDWFKSVFLPSRSVNALVFNIAIRSMALLLSGAPFASVSAWANDTSKKNGIDPATTQVILQEVVNGIPKDFSKLSNEGKKAALDKIRGIVHQKAQKVIEKTEKPQKVETILTDEDKVARTIYAEAKGESYEGKKAVASVIWNRAGGNVSRLGVIVIKPMQFSCWNYGTPNKGKDTDPDWKECLDLAKEMISGAFVPTTTHTHYYNPNKIKAKWAYDKNGKIFPHEDIGGHRFLTPGKV